MKDSVAGAPGGREEGWGVGDLEGRSWPGLNSAG